jgi:hypothetical protein
MHFNLLHKYLNTISSGRTAQIGLVRRVLIFVYKLRHKHQIRILWTSNHKDNYLHNTQYKQQTNGIRTRIPSKPAAVELRLIPPGQRDRPTI